MNAPMTFERDTGTGRFVFPGLIEHAIALGLRIEELAIWSGDACTWMTTALDTRDPWAGRVLSIPAGPYVYQGTAGIALFMMELARCTSDARFLRLAEGALRYTTLTLSADKRPTDFGYYLGRAGVAAALLRFGLLTRMEEYSASARDLMAAMQGREAELRSHDIMSGTAGAITVLLDLEAAVGEERFSQSARDVGEAIMASARRWPTGWSWSSGSLLVARDLTGLAHGTAGTAAALLELFAATHDVRFRFAAEQAFLYEEWAFDEGSQNWPDFRHNRLERAASTAVSRESFIELVGEDPWVHLNRQRFMLAWCHGAPGVGITRARAYVLLKDPKRRAEALVAAETALRFPRVSRDFSLCHGVFGADAAVLAVGRAADPSLIDRVVERAHDALDRGVGSDRWPSGVLGNVADCTLLLGEAGVGYHFLGLADPNTPSVLLPICNNLHSIADTTVSREERDRIEALDVAAYFDRSLRVCDRLDTGAICLPEVRDPSQGAPAAVAELLSRAAADHSMIKDASGLDLAKYHLLATATDFADSVVAKAMREPASQLHWNEIAVQMAPWSLLVTECYDWDSWLQSSPEASSPNRYRSARFYIVYRDRDNVVTQRISGFAHGVLSAVHSGITLRELILAVADFMDVEADDDSLRDGVVRQLQSAYDAGLVLLSSHRSPQAVRSA